MSLKICELWWQQRVKIPFLILNVFYTLVYSLLTLCCLYVFTLLLRNKSQGALLIFIAAICWVLPSNILSLEQDKHVNMSCHLLLFAVCLHGLFKLCITSGTSTNWVKSALVGVREIQESAPMFQLFTRPYAAPLVKFEQRSSRNWKNAAGALKWFSQ